MSELSYVGVDKCGCILMAATSTIPKEDLALFVCEVIREGLSLERLDVESVRRRLFCDCDELLKETMCCL